MYIYEMIEKKKSMITMLTSWIHFDSKIFIFFFLITRGALNLCINVGI